MVWNKMNNIKPALRSQGRFFILTIILYHYGLAAPQLTQNFPVLTVPHEHVHSFDAGAGFPQLLQNLPVFVVPHSHVHPVAGAGSGFPQLLQNLPVLVVPHSHFHPAAGAAAALAACCVPDI